MRKFTALAAAAVAAFAVGSAQATVILIDDFNSPDVFLADQAGGGASTTSGAVSPVNPLVTSRALSHELLAGTNTAGGAGSAVNIGSVSFPPGSLDIANAGGRDSEVKVSWTLGAGLLSTPGAASFAFKLLQTDSNATDVGLSFKQGATTTNFGNFNLTPNVCSVTGCPALTASVDQFFALSAADKALVNGGGELILTINGQTGWDLQIDSFGFQVPEPTSLALVGLAMLGAGVASRRRKA
jgi:PEP-CTERM motif